MVMGTLVEDIALSNVKARVMLFELTTDPSGGLVCKTFNGTDWAIVGEIDGVMVWPCELFF